MQRHTLPEKDDSSVTESDTEESDVSVSEENSKPVVSAEGEQQIVKEQQEVDANQSTMSNANTSQLSHEHEKCLQEIVREQEDRDQLMKIVMGVREELNFQKKQLSMLTDHTKPGPLPPIRVSVTVSNHDSKSQSSMCPCSY